MIPLLHTPNQVAALTISSNDQWIATSGWVDQTIKIWDVNSQVMIHEFKDLGTRILSLAFSIENQFLIAGGRNGILFKINLTPPFDIQAFPSHQYPINKVTFADGNTYLLSASDDKTIMVWNESMKRLGLFKGHTGFVNGIATPPHTGFFISASADSTIRFWKFEPFVLEKYAPKPGKVITTLSLTNNYLGIGTSARPGENPLQRRRNARLSNETYLLDFNNPTTIIALPAHQGSIYGVCIAPDHQQVYSAGHDGKILVSDFEGELIYSFSGSPENPNSPVLALDLDTERGLVLAGCMDSTAYLFNLEGTLQKVFPGHNGAIKAVAFVPGKNYVLTGSYDQRIIRWGINDSTQYSYLGHEGRVASLAVSADGKEFISGGDDQQAILWDLKTGEVLQRFEANLRNRSGGARVLAVDISFDKSRIVLAVSGGEVIVFNREAAPMHRFNLLNGEEVNTVSFSKTNHDILYLGSADGQVRKVQLFKVIH